MADDTNRPRTERTPGDEAAEGLMPFAFAALLGGCLVGLFAILAFVGF